MELVLKKAMSSFNLLRMEGQGDEATWRKELVRDFESEQFTDGSALRIVGF